MTRSTSRPAPDAVRPSVAERSRAKAPFQVAASGAHAAAPAYLDVSVADLVCRVLRRPQREEVPVVCEEQLVVEYYSR